MIFVFIAGCSVGIAGTIAIAYALCVLVNDMDEAERRRDCDASGINWRQQDVA